MKFKKIELFKANIGDSVNTTKQIFYGKYFKDEVANGLWTEEEAKEKLNEFFGGNWGEVNAKRKDINNAHLDAEKGNLTGIYKNDTPDADKLVIFYSDYNDCIYILSERDFQGFEESWMVGPERYAETESKIRLNKEGEPVEYIPLEKTYREHGNQLKPEQKEYIRENIIREKKLKEVPEEIKTEYIKLNAVKNPTNQQVARLAELEKLINKINEENDFIISHNEALHYGSSTAEAGTVHNSEIAATQKAIETGKDSRGNPIKNLPAGIADIIRKEAEKRGHTYEELIELITEKNIVDHYNLPDAIQFVLKRIDEPFFFADSEKEIPEKPEWLDDEFIDDIVYDKAWPVTIEEVAKEITKSKIDFDAAVKYVKDYIENNPSEKKHFKLEVKDAEEAEPFATKTKAGWEVKAIYENDNGRKFAIVYRENCPFPDRHYAMGAGYDTQCGVWGQGYYDFKSEEDATEFLFDRYGYQNLIKREI